MAGTSTTAEPRTGRGAETRARILRTAGKLFHTRGIRATSADRIIEEVGVTKVTFYRHFRAKNDLVVAYLEEQAAGERSLIARVRRVGDPVGTLRRWAEGIGEVSCRPGFRGCAFISAAAEFSDADGPVRSVIDAHREWLLGELATLAEEAGAADPVGVARQLMVLRDGAMVSGYLGDPTEVGDTLADAFTSVLGSVGSLGPHDD